MEGGGDVWCKSKTKIIWTKFYSLYSHRACKIFISTDDVVASFHTTNTQIHAKACVWSCEATDWGCCDGFGVRPHLVNCLWWMSHWNPVAQQCMVYICIWRPRTEEHSQLRKVRVQISRLAGQKHTQTTVHHIILLASQHVPREKDAVSKWHNELKSARAHTQQLCGPKNRMRTSVEWNEGGDEHFGSNGVSTNTNALDTPFKLLTKHRGKSNKVEEKSRGEKKNNRVDT